MKRFSVFMKMWFLVLSDTFLFPPADDRCDRKPRGGEEGRVLPGALGTRGSGQICLLQGEELNASVKVLVDCFVVLTCNWLPVFTCFRCSREDKSWSKCWASDSPKTFHSQLKLTLQLKCSKKSHRHRHCMMNQLLSVMHIFFLSHRL